jgi:alkylation response protein AidB-like acyl-CoA dehydrogenase
VRFALNDDQRMVQESARAYLADSAGVEQLRRVIASASGFDQATWSGLALQMGFAGLMIPEVEGGSGLGAVEMSLVLEETGRTLAVVPFFETAVLGVQLLLQCGSPVQRARWLPAIAAGRIRAAVALSGPSGETCPAGVTLELHRQGTAWRLRGEAHFVAFAHVADLLFVIARCPGSRGHDGLAVICLPPPTPGLAIERQSNLDLTRPLCRLQFNDVTVEADNLLSEPGTATASLERTLAVAAGLLAAEQTGGADFCLASTVDYAKQRVQFGRAIGSFQAVKHELADLMVAVEAARSASLYAAATIDAGGAELYEASAVARVWCCEAYRRCAAEAIQLHGGIGFTWEHHAHLYFKRAQSSASWLGPPSLYREQLAKIIGLDEDSP